MAELDVSEHEIIIEPAHGWLRIEWRELWEYRDLLALLVRRDFLARYQQTLLGPLWHFLQPVLTTLLFALVFSRVAGIPTDGLPAPLFYLCGLLGWNYFAQNVTAGGATFVTNQQLFAKVWFPRLVVPLAAIASNLIAFALQLVPFIVFFAYYVFSRNDPGNVHLTWRVLLAPLPLMHIAALSLGVSLWMSASTAKYRDVIHLNQYLVQLWMFATPVIYPLSQVPARYSWLGWANPMAAPIEALRLCLLGRGSYDGFTMAISVTITFALLISGLVLFQTTARSAVDNA